MTPAMTLARAGALLLALVLAGCASAPSGTGRGGYYLDDGPLADTPENLDRIPDAVPRVEPLYKPAMRPYTVFGREYVPHTSLKPYKAKGVASWYGKKFHGQKTSIGERYNMFAMSAAHPTLAIPSYARVTNPANGKSVIVRVNDRGPFHRGRIMDLSYAAAHRLEIVRQGSAVVEVEAILPEDMGEVAYTQVAPRPDRPGEGGREDSPAPGGAGVYVQLGAFTSADNADDFRRHVRRELDTLPAPLAVHVADGVHRVQLGPFPDRRTAERVAEQLESDVGVRPSLAIR